MTDEIDTVNSKDKTTDKAKPKAKAKAKPKARAKAKPAKRAQPKIRLDSLNPDLLGELIEQPPAIFPYTPPDDENIPFPELPDVFGAGASALEFLNTFQIAEGRGHGKSLALALAPFQSRAIRNIMGYRDEKTGTRIINKAMFCAPRKQAKTFLSAVFALLFLFSRQELNNSIAVCATGQKQARRTFDLLLGILQTNPAEMAKLRVQTHLSTITNLETGTTLVCTVAEPAKIHGASYGVVLIDEIWAWASERGRRLFHALMTGSGARRNPLVLISTTVPDTKIPNDDIFHQQLKYYRDVESGEIEDVRALPMLWICPDDADIDDEALWARMNPGVGFSLSLDELREEHKRSSANDSELASFAALRLNQIPKGSFEAGWLSPAVVEKCHQQFTDEEFEDAEIKVLGLDYGGTYDMACLAILAFDGEKLMARQVSWICSEGFERLRSSTPVDRFVENGELIVSGDSALSPDYIVGEVLDYAGHYGIDEIGVDPAMSQMFAPQLEAGGVSVIGCRQGAISMSGPMRYLESLASDENLAVADEIGAWCLQNTGMYSSTAGTAPRKLGFDTSTNPNKIDFTSAMLTAAQLLLDAKAGVDNESFRGYELLCPWTNPIDCLAYQDGYDVTGGGWNSLDEISGGLIIQREK